jgi:hypothetical protein
VGRRGLGRRRRRPRERGGEQRHARKHREREWIAVAELAREQLLRASDPHRPLAAGTWQIAGTVANGDPTHQADSPSLAAVNGVPWVGFVEDDGTVPGSQSSQPCCMQTRVSRLEPTFLTTAAEPTDTTAQLLTKVQTFGLSYPIGFGWGAGNGLTATTSTATTSRDPDFEFQSLSGLQPDSLYSFAPFATAGTPQPRVQGPDNAFVTQATPTQGPPGTAGTTGATGPPGAAGASGSDGAAGPAGRDARLFALILRLPGAIHSGHALALREGDGSSRPCIGRSTLARTA